MNTLAVVLLAVEGLVMIGTLAFTSRQLTQLERGLDEDLKRGLKFMNEQHRLLTREMRAVHLEQVEAVSKGFQDVDAAMAWMLPWVRYWAAVHHQQMQTKELPS